MTDCTITTIDNGWLVSDDEGIRRAYTFPEDSATPAAEREAFVQVLWDLIGLFGQRGERYDKVRCCAGLELGDKHPLEAM